MTLTAQEMQQKLEMRPTLLIGMGGTGQKVLANIKARFVQNYGEVPPALRLLCFDTDQTVEQVRVDDQVIRLVPDIELVNIGGIETQNILRNLDKYPAISKWITEDKEKVPTRAIVMGAQQVRLLGRLAFFWRAEDIVRKLEGAVRALTDMKLLSERRGINVFIISSVCGGTGSGAILDMAYLTRQVIIKAGLRSSFCYINGILALPSVFPTVTKLGIEANAFATLAELDYFMETMEWKGDYGNPRIPSFEISGQRPFNICYLIDARNEQGQGLAGLEEVAPMIAEAVYLQISSQVGDANNSAFDNVRVLGAQVLDATTGRYRLSAYSSFGTSSLVFPDEKIVNICGHRLGKWLIEHELLRTEVRGEQIDEAVTSFIQAHQLGAENLLTELSRDAKGNVLHLQLDPRALDQFKEQELVQATQTYLARAESALENDYGQTLDRNLKTLDAQLAAALTEEVYRLMDDPAYGLLFAASFLERLERVLSDIRTGLDKAREELESQRNRAQASARQTWTEFMASFNTMLLTRGRKVREARNRHVEMYQKYLSARFEGRKRAVGIALLANLSNAIQTHRASLQALADRLRVVQGRFGSFEQQLQQGERRNESVLSQEITTGKDVENYYQEHMQRLAAAPLAGLLEAEGPLHAWLDLDHGAIADRLIRYTRGLFEDIHQITLEQVILEKSEQVDPRKRLQELLNRSVPFWMYQVEGVLGADWEAEQIVVIGVNDRERSIYRDAIEAGQSLTSTFDPHRITVLQTKHGIPLFALTQYQDFRQAHDHVIRSGLKPLYVFPEVRPGGQRAKQVFALASAYGIIFKSGAYYYIVPPNPVDPPARIGQGMSDALRVFRNNEDMISRAANLVDEQISREGTEAAAAALERFVQEPYVYELRGGLTRERMDRSRMTPDYSVGRPGNVNYDLVIELQHAVQEYIQTVLRG